MLALKCPLLIGEQADMKTILPVILVALSVSAAQAVEYVTLTPTNPSKTVAATDLVEIVGCSNVRSSGALQLILRFSDETEVNVALGGYRRDGVNSGTAFAKTLGQKYTGLTTLRSNASNDVITLKITSASEINAVTPSSVLILPENTTGDFDVIIESSSDLVSWIPFFSQTVNSQTARRFFRTRVVRSAVQPPLRPVEPNGGDSDR